MSTSNSLNPKIARTMTGLLERTRSRRTFTKDSTTASSSTTSIPASTSPPSGTSSTTTPSSTISSKSKPKVDDLLAERSKLEASYDKAIQDLNLASKEKGDAERQLEELTQVLEKEREASSEAMKTERDRFLKEIEGLKKSLGELEERVERAEKSDEEGRIRIGEMEEELREERRVRTEMEEKVGRVESEFVVAQEAKRVAIAETEASKQALSQALQQVDRYRMAAEQLSTEKNASEESSRESLDTVRRELDSIKTALGDEREARDKAERELRRRNEEVIPHTLFGYVMSTFKDSSRSSPSRGSASASSWSPSCVIA